jgi:hypothetical protein
VKRALRRCRRALLRPLWAALILLGFGLLTVAYFIWKGIIYLTPEALPGRYLLVMWITL